MNIGTMRGRAGYVVFDIPLTKWGFLRRYHGRTARWAMECGEVWDAHLGIGGLGEWGMDRGWVQVGGVVGRA